MPDTQPDSGHHQGRCGVRYGKRRQLVCRRLAGHTGRHAIRATGHELMAVVFKKEHR